MFLGGECICGTGGAPVAVGTCSEKLATQQEKDAALGIFISVYRIDSLASGRNRFKVSKNAEQNALTGVCIMHPKLNLVIVEGGKHSVNNYRKLMLNRIDWTENPGPNGSDEGRNEGQPIWLSTEDEKGLIRTREGLIARLRSPHRRPNYM